jgi:hypothetical protein
MLTKQEIQTLVNLVAGVQVRLKSQEREILDVIYDKLVAMLNEKDVIDGDR